MLLNPSSSGFVRWHRVRNKIRFLLHGRYEHADRPPLPGIREPMALGSRRLDPEAPQPQLAAAHKLQGPAGDSRAGIAVRPRKRVARTSGAHEHRKRVTRTFVARMPRDPGTGVWR